MLDEVRFQRCSVQSRWTRNRQQIEHCRQNRSRAHLCVHSSMSVCVAWEPDYQWNVSGGVIEKNSVSIFSVLAQSLAMIADYNHDGIVVPTSSFDKSEKFAESRISIGDFPVVQAIFVSLRIGRGRFVGIMRIVEMQPHEVRARRMRRQPLLGALHHVHAAALEAAPVRGGF